MSDLIFENKKLRVIEIDGKSWLPASDIANALGYSRSDKVSRLFQHHEDEFTRSMTITIETPVSGFSGITSEVRLFSLRGAHLIGMFARTKNGIEFRKWVLDQIDSLETRAIPSRSLMFEWFEAKSELDSQNKFASLCGKGLNDHKKQKPRLMDRLLEVSEKLQPSLNLV